MINTFPVSLQSALALALLTFASPAAAEYNIVNVASGLVVDVVGAHTNDLQAVILFPSNNQKNQLFNEASGAGDGVEFYALHSYKCLDVIEASMNNGAPVIQYTCIDGHPNQSWTKHRMGSGVILKAVHSGKCLDAGNADFPRPPRSDARLQQWTCIASPNDPNAVNQIFKLGAWP